MLRTPLMKTNRRAEEWTHQDSQADIEVDKAGTDGQVWAYTERRQAGRQTDVDISGQMDRGKQSDRYERVDADREGQGLTRTNTYTDVTCKNKDKHVTQTDAD
ncbi:hypothetical protein V3C99_003814 [Haemonchus contortus]|uniref:Hva1_TUDOR domain-containing protein n=1 Tax=Haemonchus contortus TaxID=6289 RepID=A0A7I4XZ89_HAECO